MTCIQCNNGHLMGTDGTQKKVWYLRRLDLFLSLTDEEVEAIAQVLDDQQIPAGTELLHDRRRDRIYLIKEGAVRLYAGEQRQQVTLALLGRGRLFGLASTFGEANPTIGASTLEPSYVCSATWPKILQLFEHHSQVMLQLTQALAEQIFFTETWIEHHTRAPRLRLANVLLELYDDFGDPIDGGQRIRFRLTHADLARMISVSRETVSRLMADFSRAGWISRDGALVVIHNRAALEELAHSLNAQ